MKFSFDAWKEGNVAPVTLSLSIQPPPLKPDAPKFEPLSEAFAGTLPHPSKTATVPTVRYSPDGKRLLVAGLPSGVIQFWDVDARKETFRVETRKGNRTSPEFALITPDWKTLHVPMQEEKVTRVERDGKKADLYELTGGVRRWDVAAKKELDQFRPPAGWGNLIAGISPDGRFVFSVEQKARLRDEDPAGHLAVWETATGGRTVIECNTWQPRFLTDARIATVTGGEKTVTVTVYALPDGRKVVEKTHPAGAGGATLADVSADGTLAVNLGGKKGEQTTTLLLDPKTLDEVARWTGSARPIWIGNTASTFTPDGKQFLVIDGENTLNVFDLAGKKVTRTVKLTDSSPRLVVSPDGRWCANAWTPNRDKLGRADQLDPDLLPQPRVVLVDLTDPEAKPVTLIAPRGIAWGMAFRPDGKQLAVGGTGGVHLFDLTKVK